MRRRWQSVLLCTVVLTACSDEDAPSTVVGSGGGQTSASATGAGGAAGASAGGGAPLQPCPDDAPDPTPLAQLAGSLAPGEWAPLDTNGFDSGAVLEPCDDGSNIVEYADNAAWDPVSRRMLFLGSSHGTCYGSRFVVYSECDNTWQIGPLPPEVPEFGSVAHAYHHNTVDPATGDLYYRHYGSDTVWRFDDNGSQSWSMHSTIPVIHTPQCCGGLQYFPEANGLVFVDGTVGIYFYDTAQGWRQIANTALEGDPRLPTLAMGEYDNFVEYDAVHGVVLFGGGGGSNATYRLDAQLTIDALAPAPGSVLLSTVEGLNTIDPETGRLLVFSNDGTGQQYDAASDAWSPIAASHPLALNGYFEGAETDVPALGVSIHFVFAFDQSSVWVYRHAP